MPKIFIYILSFVCISFLLTEKLASQERLKEVKQRVLTKIKNLAESKKLRLGQAVYIQIFKNERIAKVWIKDRGTYKLFKSYPICYYSGKLGPKLKEGDFQAPEGFYKISQKQMHPTSQFHLAFNFAYPNSYDRAHGRTGSFIMMHGSCVSVGCFAMTDAGIEEIYLIMDQAFRNGQKIIHVHSFPFEMTKKNMQNHAKHQWIEFWRELKPVYDYFERNQQIPKIKVKNKKYTLY